MGFLYGVLEGVKDDPSVKTYTLITELDLKKFLDTMHNGVYGFGVCIDHERNILRDYVAELHKRTDAVMTPVNGINRSIEEHKLLIQQEKDVELFDQIAGWTQRAAHYIDQARQAKKALNNLDSNLYGKLKCNVTSVLQATETFMENCSNSDLHEIHVASFNTMLKVSGKIGERFQASINRVQYYLDAKINKLYRNLSGFRDSQFKELYDSVTGVYVAFKDVYGDMESLLPKYARDVVSKVESISQFSEQFKLSFEKTQRALLSATQQVATQLENFENLQRVDGIDGSLRGKVKFLKQIGENESVFRVVNDYLTKLYEDVMTPLSIAMYGIGEGFGQNVLSKNNSDVDDAIKHAIEELKLLKSIDSKFPNFGELRSKLQELGIDMGTVGEDLMGKFTDVNDLNAVIQKLEESSNMDKGDATVIFTDMATVTEAISSHSTAVYVKVLEEIKKQVTQEIRGVAGAIKSMVTTIHNGVKYDQNDKEYDYGGGAIGIGNSASGVLKLISDFKSNIYNQLTVLHKSVGKEGEDAGSSSVYRDIKKLHASIGILSTEIEKVGKKVTEVENKLEDCMKSTFEFIKEAPKWAKKIMDDLRQDVNGEIANGFENVQKKAKEIYVKRKQLELNSLHSILNEQRKRIEEIVNENKRNGVKGLMKQMNDYMLLNDFKNVLTPSSKHDPTKFSQLGAKFEDYVDKILEYLKHQVMTQSKPPQPTDHSRHVDGIRESFDVLLRYLMYIGHSKVFNFTHESDKLLSNLIDSVHSLTPLSSALDPQALPDAGRPVLRALQRGMLGFVGELGKGYVNRYDGHKDVIDMSKLVVLKEGKVDGLTDNGRNLSKVFLTSLEIMFHDLGYLREECKVRWQDCKIYETDGNSYNRLGRFLKDCGYGVPSRNGKQDGELKWESEWNGGKVSAKLTEKKITSGSSIYKHILDCESNTDSLGKKKNRDTFDVLDVLGCLLHHVNEYYYVSHLSTLTSTRHPSTVHQMLLWLAGLPHNPVYNDLLLNGLSDLFEKPEKSNVSESKKDSMSAADEDGDSISISLSLPGYDEETVLDAYPYKITASKLRGALASVCTHAHSTLTAILGHGHENGTYACEFNSNAAKLVYPANPSKCIDLLVEVLNRVYSQLVFLNVQCQRRYDTNSWRDCWYGRGIGGSSWECNRLQCPDQKGNQEHKQKCNQKCDQIAKCGLKSPLQCFLEDGLPGFLPHPYKKSNCTLKCDAPNHNGIPCKTPMGFSDIGFTASHRQQGEHLAEVLSDFCGKPTAPLAWLCAQFTCLFQRAPQTLDDMFSFYYHLLNGNEKNAVQHKSGALAKAVSNAYFKRDDGELGINSIFRNTQHCTLDESTHMKGDLFSLVRCSYSGEPEITCGRYLQPMGLNTWYIFSNKNGSKYLSWVVYLTETFYDLLKKLYEECCNNCNKDGTRCHGNLCVEDCKVQSYYKSQESLPESKKLSPNASQCSHGERCKSIATCPFTRPTLCKYGFVLESPFNLSGANDTKYKRTCQDFCRTLKRVISDDKAENNVLAKLVYETIPYFLYQIRYPFMTLTLALWLLSLLYLLHIMVIRLDLLHIKSHLHSPASHRIAAQSLLAAGRVNKLGRVFYLQP